MTLPTLAEDAIGFADVDATEPQWCLCCAVERVDPDHAPYCAQPQCWIGTQLESEDE